MTDRLRFVHFRASTTIGIASEILRLAMVRAALFSEIVVPTRVGWPRWLGRAQYPSALYRAIAAPRLRQGQGAAFRVAQLGALIAQLADSVRFRLPRWLPLPIRVPHGQEGLYFNSPNMFFLLQGDGTRLAALRRAARAVRGLGPVSLRRDREARCAGGLEQLGIGRDDWFVCLHVRTPAFHRDQADHRNARFENYRLAIDHIIEMGGTVVRMGDPGTGIIDHPRPRLIDYPNMPVKSELMDLYLIKHCRFYIGTLSGILDTAYLFHTPALSVNALHFDFRSANPCDRVLYKRIVRKDGRQVIRFDEAMADYHNIMAPDWDRRYEFVENTADEILAATREFIDAVAGHARISPRQARARRMLIRNRLKHAADTGGALSVFSASVAFSRCHISDCYLDVGVPAL